jgi:hypothetical protein
MRDFPNVIKIDSDCLSIHVIVTLPYRQFRASRYPAFSAALALLNTTRFFGATVL